MEALTERGASAQTLRDESIPMLASHPGYKFTFVNHVTTNTFFTPTRYGMADAAALLGIPTPLWTGSTDSIVSQMVTAFDQAIAAKVDGIACALIDPVAFNTPTDNALTKGIPVMS
jgi:simple sugar transport system substrate-binding protein